MAANVTFTTADKTGFASRGNMRQALPRRRMPAALLAIVVYATATWASTGPESNTGNATPADDPNPAGLAASPTGLPPDGLPQPSPTPVVPDIEALGWEPVLDENFDGPELDETIWEIQEGPGITGPGNNTRDAVRIEDGQLTITTYSEEADGDLHHYTGEIRAGRGADWVGHMSTYGYVEARVQLNNGPATRSAFWTLSPTGHHTPFHDPAAAGPEIDIFEIYDADWRDNDNDGICDHEQLPLPCDEMAIGTFHWNGFDENHSTFSQRVQWDGPSPQGNFLTYSLLWTPDGYWIFRDGRQVLHSTEAITYNPQYLILSQHNWSGDAAIPDDGYGGLDESDTKMTVDYVRIWQPPIMGLADQVIGAGEPTALPFAVRDSFYPDTAHDNPESVQVTATSSDQALLPDHNITVTGNGSTNPFGSFTNGDFDGDNGWDLPPLADLDNNTAHISTAKALSPPSSLRLEKPGGRAEQTITGLQPDTTYLLGTRYNLELQWHDTNSDGRIDPDETFPDSSGAHAAFDLGVIDPATDNALAESTRRRNGHDEQDQRQSPHEDDWHSAAVMFTTPPDTTDVTFYVDNTNYVDTDHDAQLSLDDVWLRPLVPANRTVAFQPAPDATGRTTVTLTALDQDNQELGTTDLTVTVSDSSFTNGTFEARPAGTGWDLSPAGAEVTLDDPFRQNHVLELGRQDAGTAVQHVTGLQPDSDHTLNLRGRVHETGGTLGVAVNIADDTAASALLDSTDWSEKTITFTTDRSGTASIVLVDWDTNTGASQVDDLTLTADETPDETSDETSDDNPTAPTNPLPAHPAPGLDEPELSELDELPLSSTTPAAITVSSPDITVTDITSDNPHLLPDINLGAASSDDQTLLSLTPVPERTGRATITVHTDDGDGDGDDGSYEFDVTVSENELADPGFENQPAHAWDLSGHSRHVGDSEPRSGNHSLRLAPGDEATQLVDGLAYNKDYVIEGWSRGGTVTVTAETVPDRSMVPAEAFQDEFTTTWNGTEWTAQQLRLTTTQCPGCRGRGSYNLDRTDQDDPHSLTETRGGQVRLTLRATGDEPVLVDDLALIHTPATSPLRNLSINERHTHHTPHTRQFLSVGHVTGLARFDENQVTVTSSNPDVLPVDNIDLTRSWGDNRLSPSLWSINTRAPATETATGRSDITVTVTDPHTGHSTDAEHTVTLNAGNFTNGDFESNTDLDQNCTAADTTGWCNAWPDRSFELVERQRWRHLGNHDNALVLRISSGITGQRVSHLEPDTDYVVRADGLGNSANLEVRATDGTWGGEPAPAFGTLRGQVPVDSQEWAPTDDLTFTTGPGETEIWLLIRAECPQNPGGDCLPPPASDRACAIVHQDETCIDHIGLFRADDLN